jgi:hypothetical protein
MKMKEFFETAPPYQEKDIENLNIFEDTRGHACIYSDTPEIILYCEKCGGERYFQARERQKAFHDEDQIVGYSYICKNCDFFEKHFIVKGRMLKDSEQSIGKLMKIGEYPIFGQPTPSRLITMIGPDKDIFLKGRRCENLGLGIGAYVYYRRVIELQKNRIIDQMLKVCSKYDNMDELIEQFEQAKKEIQFSTAVDSIKTALPSSLLIDNHNPLKLLHTALSKGIHEMSDEECLNRANSIRVVLTELCNRMNELLKDDKELHSAINLLMNNQEPSHAQT